MHAADEVDDGSSMVTVSGGVTGVAGVAGWAGALGELVSLKSLREKMKRKLTH